ncbi:MULTISPECIES: YggT family protein [unclassified Leptolyngbya]|uniref:YggT family protein n=1 Tax=unclassified Leptolyngbya TaxID=2650499 RepID=UPI001683D7FA|nr:MULTISPECIES: YggT family protein [unclassified Leptolyngbya]MBD1912230.1 YggT family protein [Leptolyngbya sp. FACHB-8]MBD2155121.1 YggT family protein [Leptolyngbya sp. FACHB-16]
MNRHPRDPRNIERRYELQQEEEAFRLRQEERRLELARRNATLFWVIRTISYLVGALVVLLGLRFVLRLAGANPDNAFAQVIYGLSDPFVAPFSTLFISPTTADATNIFDVNVLIAIVAYTLLGWLVIWLINLLQGR